MLELVLAAEQRQEVWLTVESYIERLSSPPALAIEQERHREGERWQTSCTSR
jgi:hypothetical protein